MQDVTECLEADLRLKQVHFCNISCYKYFLKQFLKVLKNLKFLVKKSYNFRYVTYASFRKSSVWLGNFINFSTIFPMQFPEIF